MLIVGIAGKAYAGKDTFAEYMKEYLLAHKYKVGILPFAFVLKKMASDMGWDGKKDERGRKFLQTLGKLGREYDPDFWVKKWRIELKKRPYLNIVLVPDVRFKNERVQMRVCFYLSSFYEHRKARAEAVGECIPPPDISERYEPTIDDNLVANNDDLDHLRDLANRHAQWLLDTFMTEGD